MQTYIHLQVFERREEFDFFFFWETHFVHFRLYCWRAAVASGPVWRRGGPMQLLNSLSTRIGAEKRGSTASPSSPWRQKCLRMSWISAEFQKKKKLQKMAIAPWWRYMVKVIKLDGKRGVTEDIDNWSSVCFPQSGLVGLISPNSRFSFSNPHPDTAAGWFSSSSGTVTDGSSSRFIWWYVAF